MLDFIIENSGPILWVLGIMWSGCGLVVWSCLAMSKRCEEES